MMREITPATTTIRCDSCLEICTPRNARTHARLLFKRDALDFQGAAVASADVDRDLCDACSEQVAKAINQLAEIREVRLIFDGSPGPEGPRFVEAEDSEGKSLQVGEWVEENDGRWSVRIRVELPSTKLHGMETED